MRSSMSEALKSTIPLALGFAPQETSAEHRAFLLAFLWFLQTYYMLPTAPLFNEQQILTARNVEYVFEGSSARARASVGLSSFHTSPLDSSLVVTRSSAPLANTGVWDARDKAGSPQSQPIRRVPWRGRDAYPLRLRPNHSVADIATLLFANPFFRGLVLPPSVPLVLRLGSTAVFYSLDSSTFGTRPRKETGNSPSCELRRGVPVPFPR